MTTPFPGELEPDPRRVREAVAAALVLAGAPQSTEALVDVLTGPLVLSSARHGPLTVSSDHVEATLAAMRDDGAVIELPAAAPQHHLWTLSPRPRRPHDRVGPVTTAVSRPADVADAVVDVRAFRASSRWAVLITAVGELDVANQDRLLARVREAGRSTEDPPPGDGSRDTARIVVVDLRGVAFMSVSVCNGLLTATAHSDHPVRLVLHPRGVPRRALRALGLEAELSIHHDVADALDSAPEAEPPG